MKIVVAEELPSSALRLLGQEGWEVSALAGRPRDELLRALGNADALVVRSATRVDADLLSAAPALQFVARAGTGVDNVDVDAASARGILVMNAPGTNSVSVAEHTCALMLALARSITLADASMKVARWQRRHLVGTELRGKTLGIVGLGRVGREVVVRARAFRMQLIAHDPFISKHAASELGIELVELDELCRRADFISLHMPVSSKTRHVVDAARLMACKPSAYIINTASGELVDALESGRLAGAAVDVFETEPPSASRLPQLANVIATPHIAASTTEAQELVGVETAVGVRDFLQHGVVRNAVNLPTTDPEDFKRLGPYCVLADRLGSFLAQLTKGGVHRVGVRYYGEPAGNSGELIASGALVGVFRSMLSATVTLVNARAVARERRVEVVESHSSRPRSFANLLSLKLRTNTAEVWAEGVVFEPVTPRLVRLDGVDIEATLDGTMIVMRNYDQPGVIGEVGGILGRYGINIATFTLGRGPGGAVGVVTVDEGDRDAKRASVVNEAVLEEVRRVPAVREAHVVRL